MKSAEPLHLGAVVGSRLPSRLTTTTIKTSKLSTKQTITITASGHDDHVNVICGHYYDSSNIHGSHNTNSSSSSDDTLASSNNNNNNNNNVGIHDNCDVGRSVSTSYLNCSSDNENHKNNNNIKGNNENGEEKAKKESDSVDTNEKCFTCAGGGGGRGRGGVRRRSRPAVRWRGSGSARWRSAASCRPAAGTFVSQLIAWASSCRVVWSDWPQRGARGRRSAPQAANLVSYCPRCNAELLSAPSDGSEYAPGERGHRQVTAAAAEPHEPQQRQQAGPSRRHRSSHHHTRQQFYLGPDSPPSLRQHPSQQQHHHHHRPTQSDVHQNYQHLGHSSTTEAPIQPYLAAPSRNVLPQGGSGLSGPGGYQDHGFMNHLGGKFYGPPSGQVGAARAPYNGGYRGAYGGAAYSSMHGGGNPYQASLNTNRPDVRQVVVSVPSDCVEIQNGQAVARYELISIREKHGRFKKAVPLLHPSLAILLGVLNTLLPGTGTLVAAFCVLCGCRTEYSSKGRAFFLNLLAAMIQSFTAPFVIGWVWSIMWSVTCVNISLNKDLQAMMQQSMSDTAVPL